MLIKEKYTFCELYLHNFYCMAYFNNKKRNMLHIQDLGHVLTLIQTLKYTSYGIIKMYSKCENL